MSGVIEDFKRPTHFDFMDSSELKKKGFTGLRHNSIADQAEIWIQGEIVRTVSRSEVQLNPLAINRAYEEVFGLPEIMPDTKEAKEYVQSRDKGH